VALVVLIVTAAVSWGSYTVHDRNEDRLLELQVQQTGALLQVILPAVQTPLASAAEIAATSHGDSDDFANYIASYVGEGGLFVSASLWQLAGGTPRMVAHAGADPLLQGDSATAAGFLSGAAGSPQLQVIGPIGTDPYRLGYAMASDGSSPVYVVYAESALPPGRRVQVQPDSPFADLRFALYLGKTDNQQSLLETNVDSLPVTGRTSTVTVPFGDNSMTLVASAQGPLGGALSGRLWWIVAIVGVLLAVLGAITAERLTRRRLAAEGLTVQVRELLAEQRTIAQSLQRALLPPAFPPLAGIQVAVRYLPGVAGVEIGGDWYDIIPLDGRRHFFVVGDVSGKGVGAASVMASMHYSIRGFVTEGHPPAVILDKLVALLSVSKDKHFATVLCGLIDADRHELVLANAGHLPPLLLADGTAEFGATPVGPPIGVDIGQDYQSVTITVPSRATLIVYTDGLVERRDEVIDDGMARLQHAALAGEPSLQNLVSSIITELSQDGFDDDTAVLAIRWLD
jgi:serine phosphatase RsbU (regulator of sigma subunit)